MFLQEYNVISKWKPLWNGSPCSGYLNEIILLTNAKNDTLKIHFLTKKGSLNY